MNLQKSEESIAKAETKYNDQAIKFHYDQKYSGAKSMVLPLKSLNEINNLVVTIMNYIMTNELPILQNSQIYEQAKTIIYDGFMNYVPASMIEDISSVIEGKPLKTSLSELSGIHLNSVIIQRFLIAKMGSNNLQITLLIMSYIVLCAMYKINPSIISTPTDLTMKFRELFKLCFGDDSLLNGITITSGKIELENVIKLDFDLQTGGYYTRTYGVLNNDAILSNPALSTIFQRVNEFNSLGFENKMRTIFPAASTPESPENIVRSLSIELLDTFFNSMSLPFFTTGTTPEIKDFLNGYIKYLKNDISMRYNLPI